MTDSTEARDAGVSASDDSGTNTNTEDEESEERLNCILSHLYNYT
jgi:hypothetical protein